MTDTAVLQQRLTDVEDAIHRLMTGESEVSVKYEGREVQYSSASISSLRLYKRELEAKLGLNPRSRARVTF